MTTTNQEKRVNRTATGAESIDAGTLYTPAVDVIETDDALIFKADLPGVRQEDLNIQFENGILSIDGKVHPRGPKPEDHLCREYGIGSFSRSFNMQVPVKFDQIQATLKQGELKLTVPKADSIRTRQIPILAE